MTSTTELWEHRGELFAAAMKSNRTPVGVPPLARALSEAKQHELAQEITTAQQMVTEAVRKELARQLVPPPRRTTETAPRPSRVVHEVATPRWPIAESTSDCICVQVGYGGTCTTCGSR